MTLTWRGKPPRLRVALTVQPKKKPKKPVVHLSALELDVFDLQNTGYELQLLTQKRGKGRTGFFVLRCKFGLETILHIREFALQLLPDPIEILDMAADLIQFLFGISLFNNLLFILYYECSRNTFILPKLFNTP